MQMETTATARNSVDVDVGGTFTDLVLIVDGQSFYRKVPTTPYDLSVCFMQVIEKGAQAVGMTLEQLLPKVNIVRYSTTVAMNRLLERKGPRIGLITTEGHEDAILIGRGAQWIDGTRIHERRALPLQNKPVPLVPRELIVGVKERVDGRGAVIRPLDEDDVRRKVRLLVDRGARAFAVSLLWSFVKPAYERRVKEIIREEFCDYHVGYLPVILASDVAPRLGEYARTMTAILDAYLLRAMQLELSGTWDNLRIKGYRGPFFMVHNTGGCADLFKTTASRTYNGGPVAGVIGALDIARYIGDRNVVTTDVGGTSFDIGLVVNQAVRNYEFNPIIDRWMVANTMVQSLSIGAGGGSIAWLNRDLGNRIEVGPQSTGSYPGPASYNLGGTEPTVTDADLVLGYINPDFYFGGQMRLHKAAAEKAIKEKIADPLGLDTVQAAALIRRVVDEKMSSAIHKEVVLRGYRPSEFDIFAFGGGGPTHVAGYMGEIPRAIVFPFSPVFCAYGSSIMDVVHYYERSRRMVFIAPISQQPTSEYEIFNRIVRELVEQARRELEAEGLPWEKAIVSLELDMLYGGQILSKRTSTPGLAINDPADVWAFYRQFEQEFSATFSPLAVNLPAGVFVDTFVLKAAVPGQPLKLTKLPLSDADAGSARKGKRRAWWPQIGDWVDTPIYDMNHLRPGHRVQGPAIVEAEYTTGVIPQGRVFHIDEYGLGILEAEAGTLKAEKAALQAETA
jgi:N-methylhydantoinase A/oxoprolinase/acetone carboxylase beta subunit